MKSRNFVLAAIVVFIILLWLFYSIFFNFSAQDTARKVSGLPLSKKANVLKSFDDHSIFLGGIRCGEITLSKKEVTFLLNEARSKGYKSVFGIEDLKALNVLQQSSCCSKTNQSLLFNNGALKIKEDERNGEYTVVFIDAVANRFHYFNSTPTNF